jgi:hypothetical protein
LTEPGIAADALSRRVDQFLVTRGFRPPEAVGALPKAGPSAVPAAPAPLSAATERPADFVCEDDVRQAIRHGKKISVAERTIVTPAARDLGEQHKVFVTADWRMDGA